MEKHKEHYMKVLLERVKANSSAGYVDALKNEEGEIQAPHCYRDTHRMDVDSFGECMVRDGFFLLELFRETWRQDRRIDMLFNRRWMMPILMRDLLLLENQIPLFVLRALFALTDQTHNEYDLRVLFATLNENDLVKAQFVLTEERHDSDSDFVKQALGFLEFNRKPIPDLKLDLIPHLLGLVYEALIVSQRKTLKLETPNQQNRWWKSLLEFIINTWSLFVRVTKALWSPFVRIMKASGPKTSEQSNNGQQSWKPIWTAVAFEQVGVQFQPAKDREALFYDFTFSDGVLSIPPLEIYDHTVSFFRNLVAYEQYNKRHTRQQVGNYLQVMDCLINSAKDVEILRHRRIIDNELGDDEKVSTNFNHLGSGVCYDPERFIDAEMFNEVNKFCKNPWNMWMAKLKNEYFGSPWSLISFLAAVPLLSLTILQTVYSLLSYYHPKS